MSRSILREDRSLSLFFYQPGDLGDNKCYSQNMTYQIVLTDYNLIAIKKQKNGHEEFIIPKDNVLTISAEKEDIADSLTLPKVYTDAQNLDKAIVVTLKDETHDRLVLEVSDPEAVIARLRTAIIQ